MIGESNVNRNAWIYVNSGNPITLPDNWTEVCVAVYCGSRNHTIYYIPKIAVTVNNRAYVSGGVFNQSDTDNVGVGIYFSTINTINIRWAYAGNSGSSGTMTAWIKT